MPTTSVRRRISLFSRSFGLLDQILSPDLFREAAEGEHVGAGGVEVLGDGGQLLSDGVEQFVELGGHGRGIGLVIDRVQHRLDRRPRRLRADRHQVRGVVHVMPTSA
jgi:hypothetical protein